MKSFGVYHRNPGHWDFNGEEGRLFRIRGEPGFVFVHDERKEGLPFPRRPREFKSVQAATAWIMDELMVEDHG